MNYLSVCSGIEAATTAWHSLGWTPVGFSEIERFPSAVLAHHYPDVPNFGDMTRYQEWDLANVDLLVGGTPCQSFSVAGLRAGLDDPRGNLALTFLGIVDRFRPRWVVWENVPGVLSSSGGRDFGALLGGLGQLGYGWAYRVLDAQYVRVDSHPRAVPQRRRRVFVVGCAGGLASRAAAVLFERESLSGHPPPSRTSGQGVASSLRTRAPGSGGQGTDFEQVVANTIPAHPGLVAPDFGNYVVGPLTAGMHKGPRGTESVESGHIWPVSVAPTLNAHFGDKQGLEDQHALNGAGLFTPVVFDPTQITSKANRSNPQPGDPAHTLARGMAPPVLVSGYGVDCENNAHPIDGVTGPLEKGSPTGGGRPLPAIMTSTAVRRLTPTECERLQGFPDGYTAVPYRGKPAADGPRYKALGNSMAVNVMRWIGQRIAMVERGTESD